MSLESEDVAPCLHFRVATALVWCMGQTPSVPYCRGRMACELHKAGSVLLLLVLLSVWVAAWSVGQQVHAAAFGVVNQVVQTI